MPRRATGEELFDVWVKLTGAILLGSYSSDSVDEIKQALIEALERFPDFSDLDPAILEETAGRELLAARIELGRIFESRGVGSPINSSQTR